MNEWTEKNSAQSVWGKKNPASTSDYDKNWPRKVLYELKHESIDSFPPCDSRIGVATDVAELHLQNAHHSAAMQWLHFCYEEKNPPEDRQKRE